MLTNPADEASTVFLAMFWAGRGAYTVAEILHVYDWINRSIIDRESLEASLNALLAMRLIEERKGRFALVEERARAFEAFRNKRRKGKFEAVDLYFRKLGGIPEAPRVVRLPRREYDAAVREYRAFFEKPRG